MQTLDNCEPNCPPPNEYLFFTLLNLEINFFNKFEFCVLLFKISFNKPKFFLSSTGTIVSLTSISSGAKPIETVAILEIISILPIINIIRLENSHLAYEEKVNALNEINKDREEKFNLLKEHSSLLSNPSPSYLFGYYLQKSIPKNVQLTYFIVDKYGFRIDSFFA